MHHQRIIQQSTVDISARVPVFCSGHVIVALCPLDARRGPDDGALQLVADSRPSALKFNPVEMIRRIVEAPPFVVLTRSGGFKSIPPSGRETVELG